jgi:hypothetical protein
MTVMAAATVSNSADVQTGVFAFLIVAAMAVVCVFLFRSMNKQFKKLGPRPDDTDSAE